MNLKYFLTVFVLFFNVLLISGQEIEKFEDLFHNLKLNFEFKEFLKDYKKVGDFDFQTFKTKDTSNSDYYYKIYCENKIIKGISKYSKNESYNGNFEILISDSDFSDVIIYTMCYYKNDTHSNENLKVSPGFYLFDKNNQINYFIETLHFTSLLFYDKNDEIILKTIKLNDGFNSGNVVKIYLLDKKLNPVTSIWFFNNGVEMSQNYIKKDSLLLLESLFFSVYRCKKELLLNKMKIEELWKLFEYGIPCGITYSFEDRIELKDLPIWFWL